MTITMHHTKYYSLDELRAVLDAQGGQSFTAESKAEAYDWIEGQLHHYRYTKLGKKDRGLVRRYLALYTGYSAAQLSRLIAQWRRTRMLRLPQYVRHRFASYYTREDVVLLAAVDTAHNVLSGPATRCILEREYTVFHRPEFERLRHISVSHLYNLRKTFTYRNHAVVFTHTTGKVKITLGERRKPEPNGRPGFLRVDSVHQGDAPMYTAGDGPAGPAAGDPARPGTSATSSTQESRKGVYHINFVDEVTQFEFVAAVESISERHLLPVLEAILAAFPFVIHEFHADNGSEYINKLVVKLLNRLHIRLSKSRPRRHNDNALVETKNGSIIRKAIGYGHIPARHAGILNAWYQTWFNRYLNYHRPCAFATAVRDAKGKERLVYKPQDYQTPYDKLKGLPNAATYLRPDLTFAQLDKMAYAMSDTAYAQAMARAKEMVLGAIQTDAGIGG